MFYLNFYPQRLALGFQLLFVGLNRAEKAIVGDLESFPSSSPQTRSLQIQVVPAPGFQLIGDQALNEMACPQEINLEMTKQKKLEVNVIVNS